MNKVDALFAGTIRTLEPEGQRTGIYKQVISVARVSREGIDGDQQADRRFHGGPEKALHQFAHSSYETIITTYPELEGVAIVGSIGENISVKDMADSTVCIGDIYRMGEVTLQVSQPRNPCWKINHRFNIDTLSLFIEKQHISGWYYRVLECGKMELGDEVVLLERPGNDMSIARFSKITRHHRPNLEELESAANCPGLCPELQQRLEQRLNYLGNLARD